MFPSFTGSARPRRQVNLSGRTNNPFAALPGSRTSSSPQNAQTALAQAQQERILRQQERERPPAAIKIQKTWRGHKERKGIRNIWKQEWDRKEQWSPRNIPEGNTQSLPQVASSPAGYGSERECLSSLRLLVQFISPRDSDDVQRLYHFVSRYFRSTPLQSSALTDVWTAPLLRLAKITLATLKLNPSPPLPSSFIDGFLTLLENLAAIIPEHLALYAIEFFKTVVGIAASHHSENSESVRATILSLLQPVTPRIETVYQGFASEILTTPDLPTIFGTLEAFAQNVWYDNLTAAIDQLLFRPSEPGLLQSKSRESLLWLLAYFIYFRRWTFSKRLLNNELPDAFYVKIVSKLISFLADDIGNRIDTSAIGLSVNNAPSISRTQSPVPLPPFVRSEILTLISQENVSTLLANIDVIPAPRDTATGSSNEASSLASYALTLLRAFPRRGDEIRMWLYRGSTSRQTQAAQGRQALPAIKYFYHAASSTKIFEKISKDPRETVSMLRPDKFQNPAVGAPSSISNETRDQQWRVILLFLELYTFVLKVMDDEEFLSGTLEVNTNWSWTRQSALPLDQVKELTFFLKNLAFALYWNASDIAGIEATVVKTSLAEYFGSGRPAQTDRSQDAAPATFADMSVAGVSGMTLAYMKGMVTGLLRMVYEREWVKSNSIHM